MRTFPGYYRFAVAIAVFAAVCFCQGGIAAAGTLHEESLTAFEKRAASAHADGWRFVFLGDNRGNDAKFREALQRAVEVAPLFILHGGDIGERGTAAELAHFREMVRELPNLPPLFVVRGNHETDPGLYEKIIGPRNFTLDSKRLGFRLVAVDNADYALGNSDLSYLATMLDMSRPVQMVAMHIPPMTSRWSNHSFAKGKDELIALMTERKVTTGLFAHIHQYDRDEINGIPFVISGGAGASLKRFGYGGEATHHIVVVEVKKGKVSFRVVRL